MSVQRQRILVLFAHPNQSESEVNVPMATLAAKRDNVTLVDLYAEYPNYRIDVDREQQRLVDHDVVIFLFPLYWYSTPAILKVWQDLVLEYGFAYGKSGNALAGKTFLCATSAGGAESAYTLAGYNHFTVRELLRPLEQMAALAGMRYLPPFVVYSARSSDSTERLEEHRRLWLSLLEALENNAIDHGAASGATLVNELILDLNEESQ